MDAYLDGWRRGFDFEGRSTRTQYFIFQTLNSIVLVVLYALFVISLSAADPDSSAGLLTLIPLGVFLLAIMVPSLAVTVRRLHDSDKPGVLILVNAIPMIGGVLMLVLMLLPGSPMTNRYGRNPRIAHGEVPMAF